MILPPELKLYGDPDWRGTCPTESAEQITLINTIRRTWPDTLGLTTIHVKNEGKRSGRQATWDKANGLVKGAPDVWIPGAPTFLCELKRKDRTQSRISKEQIAFLTAAKSQGAFVAVALGWEAAMEAIDAWLSIRT